ncbi:MAG: hypothetical protein ABWZ82_00965 [Candidatus Limnocylindrales bacterium]
MEGLIPPVAPAVVLSILVGAFYTCMYVVIRGSVGKHLPLTLVAAMAGAFVGHLFGRLAGDPIQLGDFNVLWATVGSWVGIVVVAGVAAIRPATRPGTQRGPVATGVDEPRAATSAGTGTGSASGTDLPTGPRR